MILGLGHQRRRFTVQQQRDLGRGLALPKPLDHCTDLLSQFDLAAFSGLD